MGPGEAEEELLLGAWRRRRVDERREVGREETRPDGVGVSRGAKRWGHRGGDACSPRPRGGAGHHRREDVRRQPNVLHTPSGRPDSGKLLWVR
jgi:hypothetical protein